MCVWRLGEGEGREEGDTDSLGWQCKCLAVRGGVGGERRGTLTAWDGSVSVWWLGVGWGGRGG